MSLSTSYNALITRGRKAGLTTRELYLAMSSRPLESGSAMPNQGDSNGFVASIDMKGQRTYRPLGSYPRP